MNKAQQSISVQAMSFHCCIKACSVLRWSQSWLRRNRWLNFSLTAHYLQIQNTSCFKKKVSIAKSKEKSEGMHSINTLTSQSWHFYGSEFLWFRLFPGKHVWKKYSRAIRSTDLCMFRNSLSRRKIRYLKYWQVLAARQNGDG